MSLKVLYWIFGISFLIILLVSGGLFIFLFPYSYTTNETVSLVETSVPSSIITQVAQTVYAELTQQATVDSDTTTSTIQPSNTETPTLTPSMTPFTIFSIIPSITPTPEIVLPTNTVPPPTMIVASLTPVPLPCNRAQLVRDVSVQDNSPIHPESTFVKTWQLKNVGSCTWTQDYDLVFVAGDSMGAKLTIPLPKSVQPNQMIDLSVTLKAPKKLGTYRGDWMLSDPSNSRFGIGSHGSQSFWVAVRVMNTVNTDLVYDFAGNYCRAEWSSAAGRIPCPGVKSATEGFVILSDAPRLENRQEDEWTLLTQPNNHNRGWISGMYPEFEIKPNHRFTAWVGCLADSKGCNITFRLDFKNLKTGSTKNLGSWHEVYDGQVTKIDLDLAEHAGKNVRFILTVEVSGGNPALSNAFWFVPGIVKGPPPTSTPTLVPTTDVPTPTETATLTQ